METVQIEETATIWRFVVMFASGDGLAVLFAASNATDWGLRDGRNRADRSVQADGDRQRIGINRPGCSQSVSVFSVASSTWQAPRVG